MYKHSEQWLNWYKAYLKEDSNASFNASLFALK
jgi:hypothetical protein